MCTKMEGDIESTVGWSRVAPCVPAGAYLVAPKKRSDPIRASFRLWQARQWQTETRVGSPSQLTIN